MARDDGFVHFIRSIIYPGGTLVSCHEGQYGIVGNAEPAVYLNGAVHNPLQHVGNKELDR